MADRRGFTLIEILVVLVIIGIAAACVLPNLSISIEQTKAQTARNNLLAIAAAQQRYFEDNASYATANLISNLRLGVATNDPFVYACSIATAPYKCTAIDATDTLTLTVNPLTSAVSVTCVGNPSNSYCPS